MAERAGFRANKEDDKFARLDKLKATPLTVAPRASAQGFRTPAGVDVGGDRLPVPEGQVNIGPAGQLGFSTPDRPSQTAPLATPRQPTGASGSFAPGAGASGDFEAPSEGGSRLPAPEGLDRTQTQPATGFRSDVPQGNFIQSSNGQGATLDAQGNITATAGGFQPSGTRFTKEGFNAASAGGDFTYIPGEGFTSLDQPAGIRPAVGTRTDQEVLGSIVQKIGEGGPAQFAGLSATEIAAQQERDALAQDSVGGFRSAQALQGRRIAEGKIGEQERVAGIQGDAKALAAATTAAAKSGDFTFQPSKPGTPQLNVQTGQFETPITPGYIDIKGIRTPVSPEQEAQLTTTAEAFLRGYLAQNPGADLAELRAKAYELAYTDLFRDQAG